MHYDVYCWLEFYRQKDIDEAIQKQKLTRKTTTEVLQDKSNAVSPLLIITH